MNTEPLGVHRYETSVDPPAKVLVLLAAHDGTLFLREQVASVLAQEGVSVRVLISVDVSSDGTESLADTLAREDSRVRCLPHGSAFGGAAPNFYRLIREGDLQGVSHVALCDQDDVWHTDKLSRAIAAIAREGVDAYSSNVVVWAPDGTQALLRKAQPQRRFDHLFSSAGPGCTYVLTRDAMARFAEWLRRHPDAEQRVEYHDWLVYAWVRTGGGRWFIDPEPSMKYRQHGANQLGANVGARGAVARLRALNDGWFRRQVLAVADALLDHDERPIALLRENRLRSVSKLWLVAPELRRSRKEALLMCAALTVSAVTRPHASPSPDERGDLQQ
ncbi:glycosyltransferase [Pedococcus bigeumensis]|uniref:glycosyltransferase n=1 Tax=Pedococcus bigeumensis TaxID=433644 RepID=UPI002FEA6EF7